MNRSIPLARSEFRRSAPLLLCGKGWETQEAAEAAAMEAGREAHECLNRACLKWHLRDKPATLRLMRLSADAPVRPRRSRRGTGFPVRVKLLVRTRAGAGDPHDARCEHCGAFLGIDGGEFQHIVARHMGGTRDPLLSTAANCALLCPQSHRLAESRSRKMLALGFWAKQGTDPRTAPMRLHGESGAPVWRAVDGSYLLENPEGMAAL